MLLWRADWRRTEIGRRVELSKSKTNIFRTKIKSSPLNEFSPEFPHTSKIISVGWETLLSTHTPSIALDIASQHTQTSHQKKEQNKKKNIDEPRENNAMSKSTNRLLCQIWKIFHKIGGGSMWCEVMCCAVCEDCPFVCKTTSPIVEVNEECDLTVFQKSVRQKSSRTQPKECWQKLNSNNG